MYSVVHVSTFTSSIPFSLSRLLRRKYLGECHWCKKSLIEKLHVDPLDEWKNHKSTSSLYHHLKCVWHSILKYIYIRKNV